jgi:hypothetical protein
MCFVDPTDVILPLSTFNFPQFGVIYQQQKFRQAGSQVIAWNKPILLVTTGVSCLPPDNRGTCFIEFIGRELKQLKAKKICRIYRRVKKHCPAMGELAYLRTRPKVHASREI